MFGEGDSLLRVGAVMMALALALVIAAIVVSVTLRSEPARVVAAEVAAKSSQKEPQRYSSSEEGPAQQHYGDDSSYRGAAQREEPQAVGKSRKPNHLPNHLLPSRTLHPLHSRSLSPYRGLNRSPHQISNFCWGPKPTGPSPPKKRYRTPIILVTTG